MPRFERLLPMSVLGVARTSQDRLWAPCAMRATDAHPVGGGLVGHLSSGAGSSQIQPSATPTPGVPPANTVSSPAVASYTWMWTNDPVIFRWQFEQSATVFSTVSEPL